MVSWKGTSDKETPIENTRRLLFELQKKVKLLEQRLEKLEPCEHKELRPYSDYYEVCKNCDCMIYRSNYQGK